MTLTSTPYSNGSIGAQLERERRALWQAHANWSEEELSQTWADLLPRRLTVLATNDASVPRHLQYELGGTGPSLALVQGAGQGRLVGILLMDSGPG